jgi:predicted transcriptional regulator
MTDSTVALNIRLPAPIHAELKKLAVQRHSSLNYQIVLAVMAWITAAQKETQRKDA